MPPAAVGTTQSVNNAIGKKFQAFKFNLTMNKNKPIGDPKESSHNFYQQQNLGSDGQPLLKTHDQEDDNAIVINEKHKKHMQATNSRGPSQLAMKQHLKNMIKSYED